MSYGDMAAGIIIMFFFVFILGTAFIGNYEQDDNLKPLCIQAGFEYNDHWGGANACYQKNVDGTFTEYTYRTLNGKKILLKVSK